MKHLFLLPLVLFVAGCQLVPSSWEPPKDVAVHYYGGSDERELCLRSVADSDSTVVTGGSTGPAKKNSERDAFVLRTTLDGRRLWRHTFILPGSQNMANVAADGSGGTWALLTTYAPENPGIPPFLVHLNAQGGTLDSIPLADSLQGHLTTKLLRRANGSLVVLKRENADAVQPRTSIVTFAPDGSLLSETPLPDLSFSPLDMMTTSDDGLLITGVLWSEPDADGNSSPADAFYALRLDQDFATVWQEDSLFTFQPMGAVELPDGGFLVNGYTSQYKSSMGRISPEGKPMWQKELPFKSLYRAQGLIAWGDSTYWIGGNIGFRDRRGLYLYHWDTYRFVHVDEDGNVLGEKNGSYDQIWAWSLLKVSDKLVATGFIEQNGFGRSNLLFHGHDDIWNTDVAIAVFTPGEGS